MYKIVDGTNDYLPKECMNTKALSGNLLSTYISHGYKQIDTPILESYELFAKKECGANLKNMFKMTDFDGSLIVMRPDMTMPIARVATTKIADARGMKFCYNAKSFSYAKSRSSELREFEQVGVELFAAADAYVDADIIVLAIESLIHSGLKEFQIEIGHVGYFKSLLNALSLEADAVDNIVSLVNSKDTFGLEMLIKGGDANKYWSAITKLPLQFGGVEMLRDLLAITDSADARNAINNLIEIDSYLTKLGYADYVSYDLSLVNGFGYYSGVVFKGITRHFGAPILSGGRYDGLCGAFDRDLPATGFAIGVNNLLTAIRRADGGYNAKPRVDVVVGGEYTAAANIKSLIDQCIADGFVTENAYLSSEEEIVNRAILEGADKAYYISADGVVKECLWKK